MLPSNFHFTQKGWDQLTLLKGKLGLDNNDLVRLCICVALARNKNPNISEVDLGSKSIKREVLFGPYSRYYELLLHAMLGESAKKLDFEKAVAALTDEGLHFLRGRSCIEDLAAYMCDFFDESSLP